jgi:deoxyhypusine synthase
MNRENKVHAISSTGANHEEDVFNLLVKDEYEVVPDWRALSANDEQSLYERGMNRVTDTCNPEDNIRHLETRLLDRWTEACRSGSRKIPSEYLFDVLSSGELVKHYQGDPRDSWLIAAMDMGVPVYSPGWEDSTTGNMFAANVLVGNVPHHQCVKTGTEQFASLIGWYLENNGLEQGLPSVGFFQIGGGIAGDFAICAVPSIIQDMRRETPFWGYFCQITDAEVSYGGYSGAVPNEKITWGKLAPDTPKFLIKSDATIVAPLIFGYLLGE